MRYEYRKILAGVATLAATVGAAAAYADLPGGHSEGYDDSHKQMFKHFYAHVLNPKAKADYPTFADGLHGMTLLAAVLKSHQKRSWVKP